MQKTPWAAKTNLKRSTFGRPCFNSFNHVFNCHAVCACVGDTTLPPPQGKCVCVRWRYNPPPNHKANVCACVGNTTLPPTPATYTYQYSPGTRWFEIEPAPATYTYQYSPGTRWFEIERTCQEGVCLKFAGPCLPLQDSARHVFSSKIVRACG